MKVVDVLTSEDFLVGLFLLIATAALTGLLVPAFKARLDEQRYRDQKVFESELARQAKIIEAQASFLDDLSELVWAFLLRALALTYYAQRRVAAKDEAAQSDYDAKLEKAWRQYDAEAWPFFARLRAQSSKAQRLTTAEIKDVPEALNKEFQSFDLEVTRAHEAGAQALADLRDRISQEAFVVENALARIAHELRLTPGAVSERLDDVSGKNAARKFRWGRVRPAR